MPYDFEPLDPTTLESYKKPHPIPPFIYVLVTIVVAIFVLSMFPSGAALMVDKPAPEIRLRNLAGELNVMDADNDKVKIIDFWASWCGPCYDQTPALVRLESENSDVEVWSVNTDAPGANRQAKIEGFMQRGGWDFEVLLDNGRTMENYKVTSFPTIVVVGKDGNIFHARPGVHSYSSLMNKVEEARNQ